jgi:CBS domain-containing protein
VSGVRPVDAPAAEAASRLAAFRPSALLARARDVVGAAGTFTSLVLEPASTLPFNAPISDARHIVWASFALDEFLTLRGAAGCKVNDVVLTVVTGALRRYLVARGMQPEGLRVRTLVPVSMRRADDRMTLGNLVSAMFRVCPSTSRIRRAAAPMAAEMRSLKERGQPRASGLAMQLAGMLPAPLNALLARALPEGTPLNTVCTNVPGPRDTCRILGRAIREVHPIVPLFSGMGLEFAILSYAGQLSICAAVDPHLVPEADDLPSHLHASLVELRDAIGDGAPARPAEATVGPMGPRVADLMSTALIAIGPDDSLAKAYRVMRTHRIRHLPVIHHDGQLIGLVTHRDVLAASSSSLMVPAEEERVRLLDLARASDVMETHVSVAPRRRGGGGGRAHDPPQDRLPAGRRGERTAHRHRHRGGLPALGDRAHDAGGARRASA